MPEFTAERQPEKRRPRGPDKRTLLLNAIQAAGKDEQGFYDHLVLEALSGDTILLKEVFGRLHQPYKPTSAPVEFEFDTSTPGTQVTSIMSAAASGEVPPDIAMMFASMVKASVEIEAATDLKRRLEELEAKFAASKAD